MLTTQDVVDLVSDPNPRHAVGLARAFRHLRFQPPDGGMGTSQRRLVDDLQAQPLPTPQVYRHPALGNLPRREFGPLTASELEWLRRTFPPGTDPSTVSLQDTTALAAIVKGVTQRGRVPSPIQGDQQLTPKAPDGDVRLVSSIWAPINEHHNAREAEAAVANATQTLPSVPASALGAMLEAVNIAEPGLHAEDALARANRLFRSAVDARAASHAKALAAAHEQQMKLDGDVFSRTALVPEAVETPFPVGAG